MRILAIDTALSQCAACVLGADAAEPVASEALPLERGHAEALLPLVDRVMSRVEGGFASIGRVAVTVGPGSYTGLRVGLSAARAIGLAAKVPVVGVTTLSALLAALVSGESRRLLAAAIDAKHGQIYFQAIAPGGRTVVGPALMAVRDAVRQVGAGPATLIGSGAPALAAEARGSGLDIQVAATPAAPDILWVARLGLVADPEQALPRPLYLRGPDARPQSHTRVARQ
jgi:tRNA threonylcarbamoyladenosine biosynthesis protein TsaB